MTERLEYRGFSMELDETLEETVWYIKRLDGGKFIDKHGVAMSITSVVGCSDMAYREIDSIIERGLI